MLHSSDSTSSPIHTNSPGSSKARVVVESCYRAVLDGEVGAARALFDFTEAA